jgi:poly(3-hydroxyalkanoate) synthetase
VATALRPEMAASLTLVAAPIDFHAGLGAIQFVAQGMPMAAYQALVDLNGGIMKGELISQGFDNLLPFERTFLKALSIWNHLDEDAWMERFGQLEDWYRCPKDLPGPMYLRAVRELFKENRLIAGRFTALGETVKLSRIRCPVALVAGTKDHITPPPQVFAARRAVGSRQVLEVEIPAGHVGTFMGKAALAEHWPEILAWILRGGQGHAEVDFSCRYS